MMTPFLLFYQAQDTTQKRAEIIERQEWLARVISAARPVFDPTGTDDEREALLQHYGFPTRWLDVVDNVQTAAWFACDQSPTAAASGPGSRDASSGYISAIAVPMDGSKYASALDLRAKPSEWLRPHIQQARGVRLIQSHPKVMPMSFLQVCTFIVPTGLLEQWSAHGVLSHSVMFPTEQEDRGRYYARCAHDKVSAAGLLPASWSAS